ncbi:hypothetical protein [Flavobacterium sp. KJJ]|uniref:hypothetical protein n=1 Tax=Flavobacterium sp. KJJ TaxID=1270193 RepID=UPI000493432B|nr:hypothetical protein [Flavobacterium sp. KJJ]
MRRIITFFILAIGFISCSSESKSNFQNSGIYGKWNWVSTDGGFAFHIHDTPASTGNSIQLSLSKDNTFSITKNGKEVVTGKYELTTQKSIYSGETEKYITCEMGENKETLNIVTKGIITIDDKNKLSISDNFNDGVGSGFVGIK